MRIRRILACIRSDGLTPPPAIRKARRIMLDLLYAALGVALILLMAVYVAALRRA